MTMGPGHEIYERFGHNAIWIRDTVSRVDLVYNYGTFDFRDPNLVVNFAKGRPVYWLGVSDLESTLRTYQFYKRDLDVQELNLPPALRAELATRLAENAKLGNREYVYDYYRDNCSTRVRDMLDTLLGGALRGVSVGKPADGTLRFHTQRSITNDKLLYAGILAAFGPRADAPLDRWGEMFLPAKVHERLREVRLPDEQGAMVPLVKTEFRLVNVNEYHVDPRPPEWGIVLSGMGLALTLAILSGLIDGPLGGPGRAVGTLWLLIGGVGGVVLLGMWFATNHAMAVGNRNVLLLSPLALCAIPGVLSAKRRGPGAWAPRAAWVLIGSVIVGSLLAAFPALGGQWNLQLAQLTALPTLAAAWLAIRLTPRRA